MWRVFLSGYTEPIEIGIYHAQDAAEAKRLAWKIVGGRGPQFSQLEAVPARKGRITRRLR